MGKGKSRAFIQKQRCTPRMRRNKKDFIPYKYRNKYERRRGK